MTMQQTSLFAYQEVKKNINKRQEQILQFFHDKSYSFNNRELSVLTGLPINCTVPRVNELVKMGILCQDKKAKDPLTERLTIYWKLSA